MRTLLTLLAYWRDRWNELRERRAEMRGEQPFNVYERLKQLQRRASR